MSTRALSAVRREITQVLNEFRPFAGGKNLAKTAWLARNWKELKVEHPYCGLHFRGGFNKTFSIILSCDFSKDGHRLFMRQSLPAEDGFNTNIDMWYNVFIEILAKRFSYDCQHVSPALVSIERTLWRTTGEEQ